MLYNIVMVFAIHQHELAISIHVSPPSLFPPPHPSPLHPSRLTQSTNFGFPASYIKLPLSLTNLELNPLATGHRGPKVTLPPLPGYPSLAVGLRALCGWPLDVPYHQLSLPPAGGNELTPKAAYEG